jgi:hypothetical protein
MKKIIIIIVSLPFIGYVLFSCNKSFLDNKPTGTLDTAILASQRGVDAMLIGAYSLLDGYQNSYGIGGFGSGTSNWVFGEVGADDSHKGSDATDQPEITPIEKHSVLPTNGYLNTKWLTVYEGVTRANIVLKLLPQATDISADDAKRIAAEAHFLRAFYHFEGKKVFGNISYIDETMTEFKVPNEKVLQPNNIDTWPLIQADAQSAYDNLPALQDAIGRANKWAAGALLGKILIFQKKWSEAKTVLEDVYNNGTNPKGVKYALLPYYQQNFDLTYENLSESIFAFQSSVNDGSGASNGNYGDVLNMPYNGKPFTCCGFNQPSQDLVNAFKTDPATGLPDPDNFNTSPVTIDDGQASFTPYAGTLDSRLDWTVGRRTIPFLDWAIHGGTEWQRDANYSGSYSPKKNIIRKAQNDTYSDNSFWNSPSGVTALNINLIRFADVVLWLAECEVELGTNVDQARTYVNMLRARAADPNSWVYKYVNDDPDDGNSTTPAANYKVGLYITPWSDQAAARKAVHFERRLEFAMEGHRFFDLARWGEAGATLNKYYSYEKTLRPYLQDASFTENKNEYYPIPQRQIDISRGTLTQNNGY